jgi:hypothetical protein
MCVDHHGGLHRGRSLLSTAGSVAILFGSFLMPFAAAAGSPEAHSATLERPIAIDGDARDWEEIPLLYLNDSVRVLSLANDADNLYLMFRFGDELLAREIVRGGVTVWVNGDNKKKESYGLRYHGSEQIASSLRGQRPPLDELDRPPFGDRADRQDPPSPLVRREPGTLTVLENEGESRATIPEDLPQGPRAASTLSDETYVYELRVPLSSVGGEVTLVSPERPRKLRVGIQIGGLSPKEREEMGGGRGFSAGFGGRGGGMGPRGGTGRGGRGGGPGGDRRGGGRTHRMMEETKVLWLKVALATSPATGAGA